MIFLTILKEILNMPGVVSALSALPKALSDRKDRLAVGVALAEEAEARSQRWLGLLNTRIDQLQGIDLTGLSTEHQILFLQISTFAEYLALAMMDQKRSLDGIGDLLRGVDDDLVKSS